MKIVFLGDSITEGVGASSPESCYVNIVARSLGCVAENYGVGGTRIARQKFVSPNTKWDLDFRLRLEVVDRICDMLFVFGGTNDYGHGNLILGSPEGKDENTFCFQLKLLISDLLKYYPKEKICFILPPRRFYEEGVFCKGVTGKEQGAPLCDYVAVMKKIIGSYELDMIDLYNEGFNKAMTDCGDEFTSDGVHPNDNGHLFIANKIIEYIKSKKEY